MTDQADVEFYQRVEPMPEADVVVYQRVLPMPEQITLNITLAPPDLPKLEGGHSGGASFSTDRMYRYDLMRIWGPGRRLMLWVMLNPSTADETKLDPTLRRCKGFAERWGFDGMHVRNIFAYRATDPADMKAAADPIGPDNDWWLTHDLGKFERVVAGWGAHGTYLGRGDQVRDMLTKAGRPPLALKVTGAGMPCHPLYLPADLEPFAL